MMLAIAIDRSGDALDAQINDASLAGGFEPNVLTLAESTAAAVRVQPTFWSNGLTLGMPISTARSMAHYSRIDSGYLNGLTGWYNGDFNYDGTSDGSDYTLIDYSYNTLGQANPRFWRRPKSLIRTNRVRCQNHLPLPF